MVAFCNLEFRARGRRVPRCRNRSCGWPVPIVRSEGIRLLHRVDSESCAVIPVCFSLYISSGHTRRIIQQVHVYRDDVYCNLSRRALHSFHQRVGHSSWFHHLLFLVWHRILLRWFVCLSDTRNAVSVSSKPAQMTKMKNLTSPRTDTDRGERGLVSTSGGTCGGRWRMTSGGLFAGYGCASLSSIVEVSKVMTMMDAGGLYCGTDTDHGRRELAMVERVHDRYVSL